MKQQFKENTCRLMEIDGKAFDTLYAEESFRGIRINPLKTDFKAVQSGFSEVLKPTDFYEYEYYIPSSLAGVGNMPLHHAGGFYVQEPSASSVLSVVNARPGEKILDLCAAPGGKSTGIGAGLRGSGILWSNEYVRKRANILLSNIERMGIINSVVSSFDAEYLCSSLAGFFDCVLVDAPCSGEGMWRHNPLVENEWSEQNVSDCASRQKEILNSAAKAVCSGGRLVYSTCTFNTFENEENVDWFLKEHPEFSLCKIDCDFGRGGLLGNENIDTKVKRIFPTDGGEGHFIALFEKSDNGESFYGETLKESISKGDKAIVTSFLEENFEHIPDGLLIEKNGLVYLVPEGVPLLKGDVLRYGLFVGELRKGRLEPAHALFTSSGVKAKNELDLSLNDSRITDFLKGMEIPSSGGENGYVRILVEGCPLGFGKRSAGRITNRYPKGLRLV